MEADHELELVEPIAKLKSSGPGRGPGAIATAKSGESPVLSRNCEALGSETIERMDC